MWVCGYVCVQCKTFTQRKRGRNHANMNAKHIKRKIKLKKELSTDKIYVKNCEPFLLFETFYFVKYETIHSLNFAFCCWNRDLYLKRLVLFGFFFFYFIIFENCLRFNSKSHTLFAFISFSPSLFAVHLERKIHSESVQNTRKLLK